MREKRVGNAQGVFHGTSRSHRLYTDFGLGWITSPCRIPQELISRTYPLYHSITLDLTVIYDRDVIPLFLVNGIIDSPHFLISLALYLQCPVLLADDLRSILALHLLVEGPVCFLFYNQLKPVTLFDIE